MSLLEVKNLSVEFTTENRRFKAVDDISFTIQPGECMALVGESGSGKSVTSMAIMRLLSPKSSSISGNIHFIHKGASKSLLALTEREMQQMRGASISMIFQEPMTALNPLIKCGEQVAEVLRLHLRLNRRDAYRRTLELFDQVRLPRPESIYHSYPHQISGGQKQRVMIASAISCRPSLLIADEPTTALDVTVQKSILHLLGDLRREYNMAMLFITHDLGIVSEISQQISVMYKGKLVEEGNTQSVFKQARHPYTKGLLACRPNLETRWNRLPTLDYFIKVANTGEIQESGRSLTTNDSNIESETSRRIRHQQLYNAAPVMKIQGVTKTYPVESKSWRFKKEKITAVDQVSLDIYPGEVLGLVGESGCGKSTLGRLVLKLDDITSGNITYRNQNLDAIGSKELRALRKKIQIVFQDPYSSLNPIKRIGESIVEPMLVNKIFRQYSQCKKAAIELLEKVGLQAEHFDRYPHEFSGGQRQRIVIARALSVNPEFIVCDECVSALDVSVQAQIINLLKDLKAENNLTLLFISHDMGVVKYISDRVAVMQAGKIVELNEADKLFADPQQAYTKHLIDAIPKLNSSKF